MENKGKARITGKAGFSTYEPDNNSEVRPLILKLGQKITDRIGHKISVNDPEYWGLAAMVSDEMAEVALKMKIRVPKTLKEMCELCNQSAEQLEPLLQEMSNIGLLEYNWENQRREKQYVLPPFVPGSAEFFNMKKHQIEEHPELASMFERMTFLPLEKVTKMVPLGGAGIGMHVIPVEKAIESTNESVSIEHISYWLEKYDGKYAASPCSCRYSRAVLGEGCADDPENWCIGVGDMADYLVETQKGHYVDQDEVYRILKIAEDNGFVHQITNIDGENKIFAICNCNIKICNALRTSQLFNTPNLSRSAYVARVSKEDCVACGRCVEYCPAGAVKLGQKLCLKNGREVVYPKHRLPDANKWSEKDWDYDYRDNNRINTYETGTAPCKSNCPAHIAVQGYLKMASLGRYQEALALIKKENPFPAVCGRICNHKCEDACTRGTLDEAVAIDEVKKFLADLDLNSDTRYIPEAVIASTRGGFDQKIAIIGAGPAGLSCANYLALAGYQPTVFEKNPQPGGMLRYGIPSYKLEKAVIDAEIEVIKALGVEIKCGIEVGKDITLDELRQQGYCAFYIAIGAQGSRKANVAGEDGEGVYNAVDFLHAVSEDESLQLSGKSVVIGGGNVAIDVARSALRTNSSEVATYALEKYGEMPASREEIFEAEAEGIKIHGGWGIKEIKLNEGKVCGIILKQCLSTKDSEGRFNPQYDESKTIEVACNQVFLSIGQAVEWNHLLDGNEIELGRGNLPKADPLTYQSSKDDIFVGGDVYTGPSFAINAIAVGKEAAESIHRYVHENASMIIGRNTRVFKELDKQNLAIPNYDNASRQIAGMDDSFDWHKSFRDAHKTLSEEQVKIETARCLGCGASIVDTNKCIGCGICTTKCEFDAIHLYRELPDASNMVRSEDKMKKILPYALKRGIKIVTKRERND